MAQRESSWRLSRLHEARLYLCVGLRRERGDLAPFLDAVLANGVDVVQLREKEAPREELGTAAAPFRAAARRHGALFIVNDDPALAAEVDADGVHVGQEDPTPAQARAVVGHNRLVGRSTHSGSEIKRALTEDCDYFAVGPVHATPTKAGRSPIGLEPVQYASSAAGRRPWFVTGGMGPATAPAVIAAGGRRFVVVRAITEADDPAAISSQLAMVLRDAACAPIPLPRP
ncbi:MAG: thiamine phosphate synthase [Actinomycetota bacterium]|nr:thiamine phosphate synthase [Actinomycetota bacterium]